MQAIRELDRAVTEAASADGIGITDDTFLIQVRPAALQPAQHARPLHDTTVKVVPVVDRTNCG